MSNGRADPFTLPEWHALRREASLVSQLIGSGATALGRASYAEGFGEYYTAFFGLSIGIERLAKLILIADHAIDHNGALPDTKAVKAYGHKIRELVEKADQIANKHKLSLEYAKPTDPICWAAVDCLASFAEASKGRYANFEAIGNPAFDPSNEPVGRFYTLCVVRWLADIFSELTDTAGYTEELKVLFGHYEFFVTYRNPDSFLLTRKRWPK